MLFATTKCRYCFPGLFVCLYVEGWSTYKTWNEHQGWQVFWRLATDERIRVRSSCRIKTLFLSWCYQSQFFSEVYLCICASFHSFPLSWSRYQLLDVVFFQPLLVIGSFLRIPIFSLLFFLSFFPFFPKLLFYIFGWKTKWTSVRRSSSRIDCTNMGNDTGTETTQG